MLAEVPAVSPGESPVKLALGHTATCAHPSATLRITHGFFLRPVVPFDLPAPLSLPSTHASPWLGGLKCVSLSEQCSPETRPVENRRTVAPVTTRSEEDKGEVGGFDQVTSTGIQRWEVDRRGGGGGQGAEGLE